MEFSLYENHKTRVNSLLSIENYIGFIEFGNNQDLVLQARALKEKGDEAGYKRLKLTSKGITGSAVFESGVPKEGANVKYLNGNIILDIDDPIPLDTLERIKNDRHTMIAHQSFGGIGYCIFVKIDPMKFKESFMGLQGYYHSNFDVRIDPSCSNVGRIRYISYDPYIYYNPKSVKFIPKDVKRFKEPKVSDYAFHQDDFDYILEQIRDRNIDLCREDYFTYMRIGMSIASHFGLSGYDKFQYICSFGSKHNESRCLKDYNGFVKNSENKLTIATFYYYVKEAGLNIYTEKTKIIINKVKVGKAQGKPTRESIASNLKVAHDITASDDDYKLIDALIASNRDYSTEANEDVTEIEQLQNFILETYTPVLDTINKVISIDGCDRIGDRELNDIYLKCRKNFDFKVPMNDIKSIINSNLIPKKDALNKFFQDNKDIECEGKMEEYARCIKPESDFNVWAFKKWLVGAVYNWTASNKWKESSPLTFVLTGQDHGTGKTSFFRNMLPDELDDYFIQTKIDSTNKDSMFRLCSSLIAFDDEFGSEGVKNAKAFKSTSDTTFVTDRRPYAHADDKVRRMAALCGTSNDIQILMDATGNRRILPANVEYIDFPKIKSFDTVALIMDAYNRLQEGFNWVVRTKEDIQYIKDNTEQNEVVLPIEELFFKYFSTVEKPDKPIEVIFNQGEILEYISNNSSIKPNKYEIKEVIIKNKLQYKQHRLGYDDFKKGIKLYRARKDGDIPIPVF